MEAIYITKKTAAEKAFEFRQVEKPILSSGLVLIKVKAFGLNYADIMARKGLYPEMPKMPCVLGYDVCGEIEEVADDVTQFKKGDSVVALTRFGGYAEYALADTRACIHVDSSIPEYKQLALATQISTAYHASVDAINLYEGDHVLIYAAAGGVGLGLVQIALYKKCNIIAIAGSDEKLDFLKSLGVEHTINYNRVNIFDEVKRMGFDKKINAIFDSVGGDYVKKGMKLLNSGGKYVIFGAAKLSGPKSKIGVAIEALKFGLTLYSPPQFLMPSKSMIGVNMLSLGDFNPIVVERSMKGAYELFNQGVFAHIQGKNYTIDQFVQAQNELENGQTIGKLAIKW